MKPPIQQPPIQLLAGIFVACLMLESPAIARPRHYDPLLSTGNVSPDSLRYFGRTNQGDFLHLDLDSIRNTRRGIGFTYYLSGDPRNAFTDCQESAWYVGRRRIPASSDAATRLLDYVCRDR